MQPITQKRQQPPDFLAPYFEALAGLGVKAALPRKGVLTVGRADPDAWVELQGPWGKARWACEIKVRLERGTLGPAVHRMKLLQEKHDHVILLTEYVTPPMAEELRKQGVAFVDAAGNAFLQDKGLLIWVTHRPPQRTARGKRRDLHAAGLRLVFVLLRQRTHDRNLRNLATAAGIALGGVGPILRELERRNWLRRHREEFELVDPAAMLKRWDEGYADTLRPKLLLKTCRRRHAAALGDLPKDIIVAGLVDTVLLGGELGAAILTRHLHPAKATLHLDGIEAPEVMRRLDLVPDRAGEVALVQAFGRADRAAGERANHARLADPLLIRGELLTEMDERLHAVAELVRTDHIEPRWK